MSEKSRKNIFSSIKELNSYCRIHGKSIVTTKVKGVTIIKGLTKGDYNYKDYQVYKKKKPTFKRVGFKDIREVLK